MVQIFVTGALAAFTAIGGAAAEERPVDLTRARREAESPLRWIKFHADKPAGASHAPAPAAAAPKPAARERRVPVRPPVPAASAPVPAPAPAPVASAAATLPRREEAAPAVVVPAASAAAVDAVVPVALKPAPPVPELVPIEQAEPAWDAALTGKLREGRVTVRFEVGTDGRPRQVSVASASDPRLGDAAVAAMKRWRFVPIDKPRGAQVDFGFDLGK
ncbi:hypothetical protein ASC87_09925 [Rhizobacter sp. Root1221]|nr:hypothetical protein ASC87_09925 [Rhizobacter sp. Root1221]